MIVADCSVVVDALVGTDADLVGESLDDRLAAPTLIDFEVVSAVRGLALGGHISEHRARDLLRDFDQLPITRWGSAHDLRVRAFDLRHTVTAYDAAYVVLAESLDCPLVTRDRRLAKAARTLVDVIVV
ncbi:type II toxin-antitoxin system VapC family toxin [Aeromicrobium ginsengisoli]|uniref:Ribonuclease VapC n=1 Tax=Aeromicrobium ginsengisoli TaxID=363867 RepID=A0A5M4FFU7_9ACTN|nr:type II toxin-antitoxin system VapC family toxin [Aeromicrobium ginsengisoli]KAA1398182.1 type II toxin-antitoxin system VapC family toxin [Aeromicrobium ginsengisoli]